MSRNRQEQESREEQAKQAELSLERPDKGVPPPPRTGGSEKDQSNNDQSNNDK